MPVACETDWTKSKKLMLVSEISAEKQSRRSGLHMAGRWVVSVALVLTYLCAVAPFAHAADEAALWSALKTKGHVALLRHALAPGFGDPPGFSLDDCSTQRNLSAEGRAQAERIGNRFRENGIEAAHVASSQWCRCMDTATLLGLGAVEALPLINSFFDTPGRQAEQTQGLKAWLTGNAFDKPIVLVTHQVNITAFTGIFPDSGELVVVRIGESGESTVLGSIMTD